MHAQDNKETVRLTFDCPEEIHAAAKMKAASMKESIKSYVVSLMIRDLLESPPKVMNQAEFKKQLNRVVKDDEELMRMLSQR